LLCLLAEADMVQSIWTPNWTAPLRVVLAVVTCCVRIV
jgi:hypothetical protein